MLSISLLRNRVQTILLPHRWYSLRILVLFLVFALSLSLFQPALAASPPGTVVAWGSDFFAEQLNIPAGLSGVIAIAVAHGHSLALKSDGTVVAWGDNGYGQTSVPAGLSGVTAISAHGYHSLALKNDGTVVAWGWDGYGQVSVPAGLSGVIAIEAGYVHSLALKNDGTVVAWGWNNEGQTSVPAGLSGVTAIAAGGYHSLALKRDGTVVAWGCGQSDSNYGQCTVWLSGVTAIAAGDYHSLALKSDGTVVGWGNNFYGQVNVPAGLSGVTAITAGIYHNLALKSDGTIVTWGANHYGQSSVPAGLSSVSAVAAGGYNSLALVTSPPDTTPPVITANVVGTLGNNGWYVNDVTVSFTCVDEAGGSGLTTNTVTDATLNNNGANQSVTNTGVCSDYAGNVASPVTVSGLNLDKSKPTISAAATNAANANGWYNGDVTVRVTCNDGLSGIPANTCPADQTLTAEGASVASTAQRVSDAAGNVSDPSNVVTVQIDKTPPTLSPVVSPNPVVLRGTATVTSGAADSLSGLASQSCGALDTSSVGIKSVICTASDNAGNTASATVNYTVAYPWTGFLQPVDNLPMVNTVNAGQAIPVKFSLGGDRGLTIFASGYPVSQNVSCGGGGSGNGDPIEETVTAGNSSLQYDPGAQTYSYIWKTDKAWAGTCRQLIVRLIDGTDHIALFQFNGKVRSADAEGEAEVVQQIFLPLVNR